MEHSEALIVAGLENDTAPGGGRNNDGITADPTIAGTLRSPDARHGLQARFHGSQSFVDLTPLVDEHGEFRLDRAEIERIRGGRLEDGPYALRLEALNQDGESQGRTDVAFTLDTTPPQLVLFEPSEGGYTSLQCGYIDVAFHDASEIDPESITRENISIQTEDTSLRVTEAEPTTDGLYRYHYEGYFREGSIDVTFAEGQISDIAGNANSREVHRFQFTSVRPTVNGIPQRPQRLPIEPNINPPYNEDSGGSVYLHSGEAFLRRVDHEIPGRGFDFRFERVYRSGWFNHETPLGHNWDFNYNRRIWPVTDDTKNTVKSRFPDASLNDVVRIDGQGRDDLYRWDADSSSYVVPPGFYTKLTREGNRYIERDRHGNVITYQPVIGAGDVFPMISFTDRKGNTMEFEYDEGQLRFVTDTLGRTVEFFYTDDLLVNIRDFAGREITFSYGANRTLESVTSPRVVDTPHGNDFPNGKTEKYTYAASSPFVNFRSYYLRTVTAPNEVARGGPPREIYEYNDDGRVIEHTYGGTNNGGVPAGGKFEYSYMYQTPVFPFAVFTSLTQPGSPEEDAGEVTPVTVPTTHVTDRNGNLTTYEFNQRGNWTQVREAMNRDIRSSDPPFFVEHHQYDENGQRLTVTHPEDNTVAYTFGTTATDDPLQQGNLTQIRRQPDADRSGDQAELITEYTYEPINNQRRTVTEPRGTDPTYRPSISVADEAFPHAERYTTTYIFDYQEGTDYVGLAEKIGGGVTPNEVRDRLANANVPMGLGDVNGDGRTDQIAGNVVRIESPTVTMLENANQAKVEGSTEQAIVELFAYNDFGQVIQQTDPEGNVTTYEYYSERDPDGNGERNGDLQGDSQTGGYLHRVIRDAVDDPFRNSNTNPPPASIQTSFTYDSAGNLVRKTDGRGLATDYVVNELDQVVQVIRDAKTVPPSRTAVEGNGVLASPAPSTTFEYLERIWYDFNDNVVLHQQEDRGNTSNVDGNPPNLFELPVDAVSINFDSTPEGRFEAHSEKGFVFTPRRVSRSASPRPDGGTDVEFVTRRRKRGLRLASRSEGDGVQVRRADGTPFTMARITVASLERGDGAWVVASSAGGRKIIHDTGAVEFSGPEWENVLTIGVFPIGDAGDVVLGEWGVYPHPDPAGDDRAFADTVYSYDILDNQIGTIEEVQNGASPHFLRTRYRYDANENLALTIYPEGNASTTVYDERDLPFRQGHGEHAPEMYSIETGSVFNPAVDPTSLVTTGSWNENQWADHVVRITDGKGDGQLRRIVANTRNILKVSPAWDVRPDSSSTYEIGLTFALLHPTDPTDYDVRGGLTCSCRSYAYDGNRNVVEVVDAADTDRSPDNNNPELGPGDRTRYVYDGFDRLVSSIDSVGNQTVFQYDPAGNRIRELGFGPTGGASPTSDGPDVLPGPVSRVDPDDVVRIQSANLINSNLLTATEYRYDELSRLWQSDRVLFVNTISTTHTPDVADGATDLGKGDLTPGDDQDIPGVGGITIAGRVSTRSEFDRKSRQTFTVEDDGDTARTFYDGVDRVVKAADPEGNTVEAAYDGNHNLIEQRRIEVSQGTPSEADPLEKGQSTGDNDSWTLNDTTRSWRRYEWAGRTVQITDGTGAGQTRAITDSTADRLTIDEAWVVVPDSTSNYSILPISLVDTGQSSGFNTAATLNDATQTWTIDEWAGLTVEITGGTGAGQVKDITSNNPFQLFIEPDWDVVPDDTSRYAIYPRPQPGIAEVFLTTNFYDRVDRLERQIDNLGHTTSFRYDSRDNLVAKADADGPTGDTITRRSFSNGPLTVDTTNEFGNVTLFHYDGINRQTLQETVLTASGSGDGVHIGATREGVKNDPNSPASSTPEPDTTQSGGGIIRIGTLYDDNSLVSAQIDDRGNAALYLYDNLDRRVSETTGLTTASGPLTKALILENREIPTPEMATIDDPAVIPPAKIDAQLAAAGARIESVAPLLPSVAPQGDDPTTTVYGYGPESNVLILEDANGSRVYIRYDAINRPIAVRVFRAGQADSHAGDPVFAPTPASSLPSPGNGSQAVTGTTKQDFQYDGLSRLVKVTDDNELGDGSDESIVTFAYDSLNRLIEEQQQIGDLVPRVVASGWRAENLHSALTYPNGRVTRRTYDKLDRVKTITDDGASQNLVQYAYIGPDRVLEREYPINGTRLTHLDDDGDTDIGFDGMRRPISLRHLRNDNSSVAGFTHTYDRSNNKLTEEKLHAAGDSERYGYDSIDRLVQFERGTLTDSKDAIDIPSGNVPQHGGWELDGAGNWTTVDEEVREHSSGNEITTRTAADETSVALDYDDNGNLTGDQDRSFEWDVFNRLRRVRRNSDGQVIAEYTYDAVGRRIHKKVTNAGPLDGATFYYYNDQRVIEEQDDAELLTRQFVYGSYIDEVLVMDTNLDGDTSATGAGDERVVYHQNDLMHVHALTDTAGGILEGYLYDAYGRHTRYTPGANGVVNFDGNDAVSVEGGSDVGNPYLFTGRRFDPETGLLYYRARYYDSELGRFMRRDPLGQWTNRKNLGNGYVYVGNNPVMWLDPTGLERTQPGEIIYVFDSLIEDFFDRFYFDVETGETCINLVSQPSETESRWGQLLPPEERGPQPQREFGRICFGRHTFPLVPDPVPAPSTRRKSRVKGNESWEWLRVLRLTLEGSVTSRDVGKLGVAEGQVGAAIGKIAEAKLKGKVLAFEAEHELFEIKDYSLQPGLMARSGAIVLEGEMCVLAICGGVKGSLGPQAGIKGSIGAKTGVELGLGVFGLGGHIRFRNPFAGMEGGAGAGGGGIDVLQVDKHGGVVEWMELGPVGTRDVHNSRDGTLGRIPEY